VGSAGIFDLSDLDGSNGFVIIGVDAGDYSGSCVGGAVDFNGDGYDDVIIGAPDADGYDWGSGETYVLYGKTMGTSGSFELSSLNGFNGFKINGYNTNDELGSSVSAAGDVNGDGVADIIIGAHYASPNSIASAGAAYVMYGNVSTGLYPTPAPTLLPTPSPTATFAPSLSPTFAPTMSPSATPSDVPSPAPTITTSPTLVPSFSPTPVPSVHESNNSNGASNDFSPVAVGIISGAAIAVVIIGVLVAKFGFGVTFGGANNNTLKSKEDATFNDRL
jgi:hypothetical protein